MARTTQGDGIGNNNGYSTVGLLLGTPLDRSISSGFFFMDLRGHIENNGNIAYNLGGGWRMIDWGASDKGVYGIHAGFDGRRYECQAARTCKEITFNWFNLGLERLGDRFDVRGNAYFNAGKKRREYGLTAVGFEGNDLLVARNYAEAFWGVDGEVGGRFALGSDGGFKAYAALGGYHFDSYHGKDATGGRARLEIEPVSFVSLGVNGSIDSRFDTSIMGRATIKFGQPPRSDRASDAASKPALARLIEFRERQELVVADDGVSKRKRALTDANGDPVPFVHVDNTAPDGGNGTYESRYNDLSDINGAGTNPGDIIILYVGDGTTSRYDQGAQLKADQYLLGQGAFGNYTFAQTPVWFTLPGGRPTITNVNAGGDALTLASGVTVDGIDVIGAQRHGFFGDGISDVTIRNVNFRDNLFDGVLITNANGTVTIEGNECTGNGFRVPPHAPTAVDCMDVKSAATGNLDIVFRNNFVDNNVGNGIEATSNTTTGVTNVLIEGNTITRSTEGGIGTEHNLNVHGLMNVTIRNNFIQNNGYQGIVGAGFGGSGTTNFLITGNTIDNNGYSPGLSGGFVNPQFSNGIWLIANGSTVTSVIEGNTITNNAGAGVALSTGGTLAPPVGSHVVRGNTITGNGAFAFAQGNDWNTGVFVQNSGSVAGARTDILVENNVMSGNVGFGFSGYTVNGPNSVICARIVNNTGTNTAHKLSQNGGLVLSPATTSPGGGTFNLEPSSGTFTTFGTINNVPLGTCTY